jgi:23S rRNA (uracil1939-C5)-methyltransferase
MILAPIESESAWKQGELIELIITDLSDRGDGVGHYTGRAVFVPDTVPGDRIRVRLMLVKPKYAHGRLQGILESSPHRVLPCCIVADKCGGCQWQHVDYEFQRTAKKNVVVQALERIGHFENPPVDDLLPTENPINYRNKSTYPLGLSERKNLNREVKASQMHGKVIAGYYQKGTHLIVNLNQCPIQDERMNQILEAVKEDIQKRDWPIYDEVVHRGNVRHFSVRVGRRTGEMLLTIVARDRNTKGLGEQADEWMRRFGLVGVCLNINNAKTNAIFGEETLCIAGRGYLNETFADLTFQIGSDTFFQVNTEQAENLLVAIEEMLELKGTETLLDAYCGVGTLALPLAKKVGKVVGIEIQDSAVEQARLNADLNGIQNTEFHVGTVAAVLPTLRGLKPHLVVLDPPRKGCEATVVDQLLAMKPEKILYMSCNPATLARDLQLFCAGGNYRLARVQPADFFPQTSHVETAALMVRDGGPDVIPQADGIADED